MSSRRAKRVGELIKEETSDLIQKTIQVSKQGFITVTDVELTNDLRHARIFVSVYGEKKGESPTLESLRNASSTIRSKLAKKIRLRYFPELEFLWDSSIEQGAKIAKLLEEIRNEKGNS